MGRKDDIDFDDAQALSRQVKEGFIVEYKCANCSLPVKWTQNGEMGGCWIHTETLKDRCPTDPHTRPVANPTVTIVRVTK